MVCPGPKIPSLRCEKMIIDAWCLMTALLSRSVSSSFFLGALAANSINKAVMSTGSPCFPSLEFLWKWK